jgi:hypothetical protein
MLRKVPPPLWRQSMKAAAHRTRSIISINCPNDCFDDTMR